MKHNGDLYCYLVSCNGGSTSVAIQVSLSNTCTNHFVCSVHLSFECCLVVTCFSVLLYVVLNVNNSSTIAITFRFKLLLCISLNMLFEAFVVQRV
jgi:predicted choloylglycine hydrolase